MIVHGIAREKGSRFHTDSGCPANHKHVAAFAQRFLAESEDARMGVSRLAFAVGGDRQIDPLAIVGKDYPDRKSVV